jgi:hypothetical protein
MKKYLYKLLIFLTIPVFVIILIEVFFNVIKVPKISYPDIYYKSQNLIPQINSNTILFLGDSRVEWGIKPLIIKNTLNCNDKVNVINLAMPGSNGLDILTYLKAKSIYPKIIILGYTPNYGRYENHGLDKIKYTKRNRVEESVKYYLKQNSFVYDYNSIKEYLFGEHPLHLSHEYDKWGGVNVIEYGNYQYKKDVQMKIYKSWSDNFDKDKLYSYHASIEELKKWFMQGGTKIYGLYMPTADDLIKLEKPNYNGQNVTEMFEEYYDYSKLEFSFDKVAHDSVYIYDGSHLKQEYGILFSKKFAEKLKTQVEI